MARFLFILVVLVAFFGGGVFYGDQYGAPAWLSGLVAEGIEGPAVADIVQVENIEPVTTEYMVAIPTNVYNNHFVYDTEVTGQLERGETVEALGKVPGYEWLLVGRDGEELGYVPISMLSPADL